MRDCQLKLKLDKSEGLLVNRKTAWGTVEPAWPGGCCGRPAGAGS